MYGGDVSRSKGWRSMDIGASLESVLKVRILRRRICEFAFSSGVCMYGSGDEFCGGKVSMMATHSPRLAHRVAGRARCIRINHKETSVFAVEV